MKIAKFKCGTLILAILFFSVGCSSVPKSENINPLPSWNAGPVKLSIIEFVTEVTDKLSPAYVQPADRIATFDNDGCLWSEQPMYFQLFFAMDRVRSLAAKHPEWKNEQPFQAVLENDMQALVATGERGLLKLVMATHAGMTTAEYERIVQQWIATAKHPRFNRPFTELVFQPMLELLHYLRANGFKTYIVSGGGIEFMRPWTDRVYGIPSEQVIGSSIRTEYQYRNGNPALVRLAAINFVDDKAGKPVGINQHIGKRPILAFGNSIGDREMLQWTQAGKGSRFMGLVHHTDAKREWAYGPKSKVGTFSKQLLQEAKQNQWHVVDMAKDWKVIYPFEIQ